MRRFSADYLRDTRAGMWNEDDRAALAPLDLDHRRRVLDVGCGTGELSRVLADETPGEVVGVDADPSLLSVARAETGLSVLAGDACRLPIRDGAFDLVVCQALLVNLPDPARAVDEFVRVSSDLVAAVEPDNSAVGVDSTVESESDLARRVREAYLDGVRTDPALGDRVVDLFREAGLVDVETRRYHHRKVTEPPYDDRDLQAATRKATGAALTDRETALRRGLGSNVGTDGEDEDNDGGVDVQQADERYDRLRSEWRAMGRDVVEQVAAEEYRRVEVVPFDVTVGRVPA